MSADTFKSDESTATENFVPFYVEDVANGQKIPATKLYFAAKGSVGVPVSPENPLPISIINETGLAKETTLADVKAAVETIAAKDNTVETGLAQPVVAGDLVVMETILAAIQSQNEVMLGLVDGVYSLTNTLSFLSGIRDVIGALRIIPVGGSVGTVTTVTTVTSLNQFSGLSTGNLPQAWTNQTAQSNIRNCIG